MNEILKLFVGGNLLIILIIIQVSFSLSQVLDVYEHKEYLIFYKGNNTNSYEIEMISDLNTNINRKLIEISEFYYIDKDQKKFNSTQYYNSVIFFEEIDMFYSSLDNIMSQMSKISAVIINSKKSYINKEKIKDLSMYIFIYNNNNEEIRKNRYNQGYIKINAIFTGDIMARKFSLVIFIILFILLFLWGCIYQIAKKKKIKIFVHSMIYLILIFFFLHSFFFMIWFYSIDDMSNISFSGLTYNITRILFFFIKLLQALFGTFQVNIIELREHYYLIRNSKTPIIYCTIIFFFISFEGDDKMEFGGITIYSSELFNFMLYITMCFILISMSSKILKVINERISNILLQQVMYLQALRIKKKVLIMHIISFFLFFLLFAALFCYFHFNCTEYRTMKIVVIFTHYSDILLILFLIIVYFPRKLPDYFVEDSLFENDNFLDQQVNGQFENIFILDKSINETNYFENYQPNDLYDLIIVENPFSEITDNLCEVQDKNTNNKNINNNSNFCLNSPNDGNNCKIYNNEEESENFINNIEIKNINLGLIINKNLLNDVN